MKDIVKQKLVDLLVYLNQCWTRSTTEEWGQESLIPQSVRRASDGKKVGGKSLKGKMSAEQWGQARVYSFVMKQPGTWGKADKDLADKVKKSKSKSKKKIISN